MQNKILNKIEKAADYAAQNAQEHLLDYLEAADPADAKNLADDILSLDLREFNLLNASLMDDSDAQIAKGELEPANIKSLNGFSEAEREAYEKAGLDLIRTGRAAALTMAGGQGSRLGYSGPKGSYVLPTDPPKSFFEIQAKRLLKLQERSGSKIPWLIMTSHENHSQTLGYFKSEKYFGLDSEMLYFFPQNRLPVTDLKGKLLVKDGALLKSPDGNGGVFAAIKSSGLLDKLTVMGVEKLFICGIDNILVKILDPVFLGFSLEAGQEITSKSVIKLGPDEKAGIFCLRDGKPFYLEYTELSEEHAKQRNSEGDYVYGDIGIVAYIYNISLLKKLADKPLPYHAAVKRTDYDRPDGSEVVSTEPNSVKLESFIFDSFEYVDNIAVLRVDRDKEFLPVKNLHGEDSAENLRGFPLEI